MDILLYLNNIIFYIISYEWTKELINNLFVINQKSCYSYNFYQTNEFTKILWSENLDFYSNDKINTILWIKLINTDLIHKYEHIYNLNISQTFKNRFDLFSKYRHDKAKNILIYLKKIYLDQIIGYYQYINSNIYFRRSLNNPWELNSYNLIYYEMVNYEIEFFLQKMEFLEKNQFIIDYLDKNSQRYNILNKKFYEEDEFDYPQSFKKQKRKTWRKYFYYNSVVSPTISSFCENSL